MGLNGASVEICSIAGCGNPSTAVFEAYINVGKESLSYCVLPICGDHKLTATYFGTGPVRVAIEDLPEEETP